MWKIIFAGALCLIVAIAIGVLGAMVYRDLPWLSATLGIVDFGVIFAGFKMTLDMTKTANELRKMKLDIEKLHLEIAEKKAAAEKAEAYVTVATLDDIQRYAHITLEQTNLPSRRKVGSALIGLSSAIIAVLLFGSIHSLHLSSSHSIEALPPEETSPTGEHWYTCNNVSGSRAFLVFFAHYDDRNEARLIFSSESSTSKLRDDFLTAYAEVFIRVEGKPEFPPLVLSWKPWFGGSLSGDYDLNSTDFRKIQSIRVSIHEYGRDIDNLFCFEGPGSRSNDSR